jgi:AcrR family transcriptional regulator
LELKAENTNPSLPLMTIKELCEATGVTRSTVYHYLRSGLLHSPIKEGPTKLRYDQRHKERLQEIRHFREKKKLSLTEIQKMFQVSASDENILEKDADEVKNLIIDKAIALISRKGFAKTKISDLAEELNMGKGTFYLYFKSKEELFLKCIERFSDLFLPKELWDDIRKERHFFKRAYKRMFYMLESFQTFMGIVGIVKLAIRGEDPELSRTAMDCFQVIISPTVKEMQRNIESGIVRQVDAQLLSFVLFGVGEAAGYWRMIHPEYTQEETAEKILDFITLGLASNIEKEQWVEKEVSCRFTIVDQNKNTIQLKEVRINGSDQLQGRIGSGTLQIPLLNIEDLEMAHSESGESAQIKMASDEKINVQIDSSAILTGQSSFGNYSISLGDVAKVKKYNNYQPHQN